MKKYEFSNYNPANGNPWNSGCSYKEADWFISYDIQSDTTALVICGADGIGVFFIVLQGNHEEEFKSVVEKYEGFNKDINGCLGECIRFACSHKDVIPSSCAIGGWKSNLIIRPDGRFIK